MNGSPQASSEVSRTRCDVSKVVILGEGSLILDAVSSHGESLEDLSDVGSLLHGDDSKLVLFVNPHKEGLVVIMEDASSTGPVSV